jgi:xanthosine utilization system XapX-like protein
MVGMLIAFGVGLAVGVVGALIAAKKGWIDITKVPAP